MTAFSIAYTSKSKWVHRQLPSLAAQLANLEYQAGCWHSFLARAKLFFLVYGTFNSDPNANFLFDSYSQSVTAHLGLLDHVTQRLYGDAYKELKLQIDEVGLCAEDLQSMRQLLTDVWGKQSESDIGAACKRDINERPFSDGGKERILRWEQSGVCFKIVFLNTFIEAHAAEQLAAGFQILLTDLTKDDLYILPGSIDIDFSVAALNEKTSCEALHDNNSHRFKVLFSMQGKEEDPDTDIISCLVTVVNAISALPYAEVMKLIEKSFKDGLSGKLFCGGTFAYQLSNSMTASEYDLATRHTIAPFITTEDFPLSVHIELAWNNSLVKEYNSEVSLAAVSRRYERTVPVIRHTLKRLKSSSRWTTVLSELRNKGWRDWHILMGLANLVVNFRVNMELGEGGRLDHDKVNEVTMKIFHRAEEEGDPFIPEEQITVDAIDLQIRLCSFSTFKNLGLQMKTMTPHFPGTMKFLISKCGHNDDISHSDPF